MSTPFGLIEVYDDYEIKYKEGTMPKDIFESIIEDNPNGHYIYKRKY